MAEESTPPAANRSPDAPPATGRGETIALGCLFGVMYFIQGIGEPTEGLIAQPVRSLLRAWGHSAGEIAGIMAIVGLPWPLKPLYGLISDFLPIFGSRRKSYLLLTSAMAVVGLLAISALPLSTDARDVLLWLLLVPTIGVAFTDVVIDALMVEVGQPRGLTGRLQSIQWAAIYSATILTGTIGGWLTQHGHQRWAFLICAVAIGASFVLVLVVVREPPLPRERGSFVRAAHPLWQAARTPAFLAAVAFLFLWSFNPFSSAVLYLYQTEVLGLSEQYVGHMTSLLAVASVAASISYGLYCRRVPFCVLIHVSIIMGILATLAYWGLSGPRSAAVIAGIVGFTYMTGMLIQLDLAARICPPEVAGTVFATLMAISNFGMLSSEALGGRLFDHWSTLWGPHVAFDLLVAVGALFTAGCWLLLPWLGRSTTKSSQLATEAN